MDKRERVADALAQHCHESRGTLLMLADAAIAALEPVTVREMPLLEIAEAMQELLERPMGVVPACADKYYDSNTGVFTADRIARALADTGEDG